MSKVLRRLRDLVLGLSILALALLIIAKLENEQAQRFDGSFAAIDGDTLLAGGERLRLEGVDAPELDQSCLRSNGASYACGQEARRFLATMVSDGAWTCSGMQRDRYQRLLVICREGSRDLGALLVLSGRVVADGRYLAEEGQARRRGEGIWGGSFERPYDWRRVRKLEEAEHAGWVQTLWPRWLSNWFEE